MEWDTSPDTLIQTFHNALPNDPRLERRKMFGYPCSFVEGRLIAGLHKDSLFVRLPEPVGKMAAGWIRDKRVEGLAEFNGGKRNTIVIGGDEKRDVVGRIIARVPRWQWQRRGQ